MQLLCPLHHQRLLEMGPGARHIPQKQQRLRQVDVGVYREHTPSGIARVQGLNERKRFFQADAGIGEVCRARPRPVGAASADADEGERVFVRLTHRAEEADALLGQHM